MRLTIALVLLGPLAATAANAAKKCNVAGAWTDNFDSPITLKSNKHGSARARTH